ncbi:unnamed protein product [Rotaria magnacalcarata]|uniref:Uncharacterized protein n=2 Tax=Rotaria magnacalcarata TaxID=392030 RepID=A0A816N2H4_9BILA|nr:unnamed protein product [Rotaria magnacalcarata]
MTIFNYVIVGGGPAGLSARYGWNAHHETKYLLVDSGDGLSERVKSNDKTHIGSIGGAGLCSDGYFVFYPVGNGLCFSTVSQYEICGPSHHSQRFLGCHADMALDVATSLAAWFANTQNSDGQATINSEKRRQKKQSTLHLTFEQRTTLITSILHAIKPNQLSLNTKLYQIESTIDNTCILNLVVSFFPIVSQSFPMIKHVFKQVAVGVRICGPANNSLFSDATQVN